MKRRLQHRNDKTRANVELKRDPFNYKFHCFTIPTENKMLFLAPAMIASVCHWKTEIRMISSVVVFFVNKFLGFINIRPRRGYANSSYHSSRDFFFLRIPDMRWIQLIATTASSIDDDGPARADCLANLNWQSTESSSFIASRFWWVQIHGGMFDWIQLFKMQLSIRFDWAIASIVAALNVRSSIN